MSTKLFQWMMAAIFVCCGMVFISCSDDKDADIDNLSEKIIGKWMFDERNGEPTPTNKKRVFTFISDTKAYVSAALPLEKGDTKWFDHTEADVAISGNTVTLTMHLNEHTTMVDEFNITAIDDTKFTAILKVTVSVNGIVESSSEYNILLTKVKADYSEAILGMWEGHVTSEQGSAYDDGEDHQWEYKNDSNFVYYIQDEGGNWIEKPGQTISEYFVDGTLLCTHWVDNGTDNREWWEIASIKDGVMKWTALRQKDDGTTYVATFEMKKK